MAGSTTLPPNERGRKRSNNRVLKLSDVTLVKKETLKRAIAATALGNAMEWFDFGVYAYFATTIGRVFFPGDNASIQLLATFGAFAAAFLMRPIGGLVLGPLGDKIGRQKILAFTMIMMSVCTFCIGLIPSYNSIGVLAPILLLILRMIQGFSTGGEFGGAATFIAEYSPDRMRGFLGSWLEFGTFIGYILAAVVVTVLTSMLSESSLLSWGWRIPFFIAGPIGIVGLYMRMKLEETPAYSNHDDSEEEDAGRSELVSLVSGHWRPLLLCAGLVLVYMVADYMLLSYMPTYMTASLHHDASHSLYLIILVMVVMMVIQPFMGMASDIWGRRPIIFIGCIGFVILSIPCLWLIQSTSMIAIFFGLMILGALLNTFTAVMPSTLPALFPTAIRYGAVAIGLNISTSLFGGTTPLVTTWLIDAFGTNMMPAYYLMLSGVIGAAVILLTAESSGKPLIGSNPAAMDREEAREVLTDYHDDIESQINAIDEQMAALAKERRDLVDQHPRID